MRILLIHNHYREIGGEDSVFKAEQVLLRQFGHEIQTLVFDNDEIPTRRPPAAAVSLAIGTIWSRSAARLVRGAVRSFRPEVVHFHNTFPLVSPAAYSAAREGGAAVVQTLHNYRLVCPNGLFFRDGQICEDCLGRTLPLPGVMHSCYRDSHAQTAVVAMMLTVHRLCHTWSHDIDRYIALTDFARQKFIEGGLPEDRIVVKPNFVDIPAPPPVSRGGHFLFVGRLSTEKGIKALLESHSRHRQPLRIVGDGPLADQVHQAAANEPSIESLGRLSSERVHEEMRQACGLIFPSRWYEGFPVTIAEAFANGLPVIVSRLGAMAELVENGTTGLHFVSSDADDLAAKVRWAADHPSEMRHMGENARRQYEAKYTPEHNYNTLMEIYGQAISRRGHSTS